MATHGVRQVINMNAIRAFIAVEIDAQTKKKISEILYSLKKSKADVKWVSEDQMHLTLKFLGNIEKDRVREISNALTSISNNFMPFAIHLSQLGAFPNINHPRVIWIGIDRGCESLKNLAEKIEVELEKLGVKKEIRPFKAHLTLGRVRSSKNLQELTKLLKKITISIENDINITELILFQSNLTPHGAIYLPLSKSRFYYQTQGDTNAPT